jgi:hypothetical protein
MTYSGVALKVYMKLLEYASTYYANNKYYIHTNPDYTIKVWYKGIIMISLEHTPSMKRTVDDISSAIVNTIKEYIKNTSSIKEYFSNDNNIYSIDTINKEFSVGVYKR